MDVLTTVAPLFATNCYVLIADDAVSCVIVDVGGGVEVRVLEMVAARGLRPVAVLATHGHADHTWGSAQVADAFGVALHLHAADAYRLADPLGTLGLGGAGAYSPLAQALAAAGTSPAEYRVPARVETFTGDGDGPLELGGLLFAGSPLAVVHAPGHTQGASIYVVDGAPGPGSELTFVPGEEGLAAAATRTALTGDVLFAGTIGRTDLPGGDDEVMAGTLRALARTLSPGTLLLPGHGPATRMDLELRRNPYLAG